MANVPLVGKVTFVAAVELRVILFAPVVTKFPPNVIVLPVLSTPVPPFAEGKIPDTDEADILPIALVTYSVFAIVPSFELTIAVGT